MAEREKPGKVLQSFRASRSSILTKKGQENYIMETKEIYLNVVMNNDGTELEMHTNGEPEDVLYICKKISESVQVAFKDEPERKLQA